MVNIIIINNNITVISCASLSKSEGGVSGGGSGVSPSGAASQEVHYQQEVDEIARYTYEPQEVREEPKIGHASCDLTRI